MSVLKVALAAGLIVWMVSTGRLNLGLVSKAATKWPFLLAAVVLFYFQLGITAWRWNHLLRAQDITISFRDAFSLTMIGSLFNVVIPGSVGGDVIKGYYIAREADTKRSVAVTTILLDRVIGLLGLVSLAAGAAAWNYSRVAATPMRGLSVFTMVASGAGLIGVVVAAVVGPQIRIDASAGRVFTIIGKVLQALRAYRQRPMVLVLALVASALSQALACSVFYLCAHAIGGVTLPFHLFLLVVPLGLVTTALPLSPAGIGVGQAAFYSLFHLAADGDANLGANTFTLYQAVCISVYCTGFYSYFTYQKSPARRLAADISAP